MAGTDAAVLVVGAGGQVRLGLLGALRFGKPLVVDNGDLVLDVRLMLVTKCSTQTHTRTSPPSEQGGARGSFHRQLVGGW